MAKVTIVIPDEINAELRLLIKKRFGNGNVRAFSLIIREALRQYLDRERVKE